MSETRATNPVFPPGRYGRRRAGGRRRALPIVILVVVLAVSVLASVRLYQRYGQTDYEPQIVSWAQSGGVRIKIRFQVRVPAGHAASCVLRARDYQGFEVGRDTVVVRAAAPGDTTIDAEESFGTSRRASVGEVLGCQPTG